ncbi:MAG: TrkH family potassium uptake protein [Nitrospirae bacterium]|nr:MAG: TrkH family potassium uptake protein [Nitrospirota bacterium]
MERAITIEAGAAARPRRRAGPGLLLHYLGHLLQVAGVALCVPLIPYLLEGELARGVPLATYCLPALGCLAAGRLLGRGLPAGEPTPAQAMAITGLGWIAVSAAGALPFVIALHKPFADALFEAASAFTTTGITVFEGLDAMPRSILVWRSLMQWLGGLGILTFFLAVGLRGGGAAAALFGAEGHKIASARPVPGIVHTVKLLWAIYLVLTAACMATFLLLGMPPFDAANHALTCISTGGFSTHDASFGWFAAHRVGHPRLLEYAASLFMLAGGINFLVHFRVATGEPRALFRGFEMRWFWGIVAGATALTAADHLLHHAPAAADGGLEGVVRACLFQVCSLVTSTGYGTVDINAPFFPALSKELFLAIMVVGGCVGSTAGGIKVLRLGILVELFRNEVRRLTRPRRAVMPLVVDGEVVPDAELRRIAALVTAWIALVFAGAAFTAALSPLDGWQALSGMASAVGNMGPFYFSVHQMAAMPAAVKLLFTFGMLAGRLEILPLAVLFTRPAWR